MAALKSELGSLDRVTRIVKVSVFVASADTFTEQPKVANGASDLSARCSVTQASMRVPQSACPSLPLGVPVEVDLVAEVQGPSPSRN